MIKMKILSQFSSVIGERDFPEFLQQHPLSLIQGGISQNLSRKQPRMCRSTLLLTVKDTPIIVLNKDGLKADHKTVRNTFTIGTIPELVLTGTAGFYMKNLRFVNLMAGVPGTNVCSHMSNRKTVF